MDREKRLLRRWKFSRFIAGWLPRLIFRYRYKPCLAEGPCIVISNHVTNWDPFFVSSSFSEKNLHFVASENILHAGIGSKIVNFLLAPIGRRKGATGSDTVMAVLRTIRAGGSICLFAEGDTSWDGVNIDVFPATGKMVRSSGASLITYRIEGGYRSLPRWSRKPRRGKLFGHAVGVYTPEQLKAMKPAEINEIINRDIHEDAWERQKREHVRYKGKNLAEGMERAVFICPQCRKIDTVTGAGNHISCACGFALRFTDEGFFEPARPFETIREWNLWQIKALAEDSFVHGEELFSDAAVTLRRTSADKGEELDSGTLIQRPDRLILGQREIMLSDISTMAMFKDIRLLFTIGTDYYELSSTSRGNMRKYLLYWQTHKDRFERNKSERAGST